MHFPTIHPATCSGVFVLLIGSIALAIPDYHAIDLYTPGTPPGFGSISQALFVGNGGTIAGYGLGPGTNGRTHALLWSPEHPEGLDLNGNSFASRAMGANGSFQVGVRVTTAYNAVMWSGTPSSAVVLHPLGYNRSQANAVQNGEQVGTAEPPSGVGHAMLWHGSAASAVDLHSPAYFVTQGTCTDGHQQGGVGFLSATSSSRALLWSGTADSIVDLHPSGFTSSGVGAVAGGFQVGFGTSTGIHALLWHGSSDSVIDLGANSWALGTNGSTHVGLTTQDGSDHAVAWWAASPLARIDLHSLLPSNFQISSATWVDADGTIYGYARDGQTIHAVMWVVPEPSGAALLFVLIQGSMLRRVARKFVTAS